MQRQLLPPPGRRKPMASRGFSGAARWHHAPGSTPAGCRHSAASPHRRSGHPSPGNDSCLAVQPMCQPPFLPMCGGEQAETTKKITGNSCWKLRQRRKIYPCTVGGRPRRHMAKMTNTPPGPPCRASSPRLVRLVLTKAQCNNRNTDALAASLLDLVLEAISQTTVAVLRSVPQAAAVPSASSRRRTRQPRPQAVQDSTP